MITATDLEVRAGARTLLLAEGVALRVAPGDRIGLVGRNGAGKTTTMRILAGEGEPYAGTVTRTGEVGYLPQDPREGDLDVLARDRVLSARGLDALLADLEKQQVLMAEVVDDDARDKAIRRYGQLEERFAALGGYAAESEAGRICASLGLPDRVLTQPLRTLSGGQRRRVELARILFAASESGAGSSTTLLLDEPTNHLDADSINWLRDFLKVYSGGLVPTWSTGCGSLTPSAVKPTSTTWVGRNISTLAPPTNSAAAGNGSTPRRRRPHCAPRPPNSAPKPPKPLPRRICCAAPSG